MKQSEIKKIKFPFLKKDDTCCQTVYGTNRDGHTVKNTEIGGITVISVYSMQVTSEIASQMRPCKKHVKPNQ